jgi:hypothetical protein
MLAISNLFDSAGEGPVAIRSVGAAPLAALMAAARIELGRHGAFSRAGGC